MYQERMVWLPSCLCSDFLLFAKRTEPVEEPEVDNPGEVPTADKAGC